MPGEVIISYLDRHTEHRTIEEAVKLCSNPAIAPEIMEVTTEDKNTERRLNALLDSFE